MNSAHMARAVLGQPAIFQQPRVEGGNTHHHSRLGQRLENRVRLELGKQQHAGARQQGNIGGDEKPMNVEDRQRVQQHIVLGKFPSPAQAVGIRIKIAMGEHGALRAAGGTGRVKNGRQVAHAGFGVRKTFRRIGCLPDQRSVLTVVAQGQKRHRRQTGRDFFPVFVGADKQARLGVLNEIGELRRGVSGVQRQIDKTGPETRQI